MELFWLVSVSYPGQCRPHVEALRAAVGHVESPDPSLFTDLNSFSPGTSTTPTMSLRSSSSCRRKEAVTHRYVLKVGGHGVLMTGAEGTSSLLWGLHCVWPIPSGREIVLDLLKCPPTYASVIICPVQHVPNKNHCCFKHQRLLWQYWEGELRHGLM